MVKRSLTKRILSVDIRKNSIDSFIDSKNTKPAVASSIHRMDFSLLLHTSDCGFNFNLHYTQEILKRQAFYTTARTFIVPIKVVGDQKKLNRESKTGFMTKKPAQGE